MGTFIKSERGELQLTEYGISGIPVFQLSTYAIRAVKNGRRAELRVNFLPELSEKETEELLHYRKKNCPYKKEKELLTGLFPGETDQGADCAETSCPGNQGVYT